MLVTNGVSNHTDTVLTNNSVEFIYFRCYVLGRKNAPKLTLRGYCGNPLPARR